uniref:Uncharacterized protein n=1 Tax=Arundo donax TaxID=35708 RepID=A0A0A9EXU1_ARUDO
MAPVGDVAGRSRALTTCT